MTVPTCHEGGCSCSHVRYRLKRGLPMDIHIFTSTKYRWLKLDGSVPVITECYDWREYWPAESIRRYQEALARSH